MEVAYVEQVDDQEVVVHKRNISMAIGCGCRHMRPRRYQQIDSTLMPDKWFWISDEQNPSFSEAQQTTYPNYIDYNSNYLV